MSATIKEVESQLIPYLKSHRAKYRRIGRGQVSKFTVYDEDVYVREDEYSLLLENSLTSKEVFGEFEAEIQKVIDSRYRKAKTSSGGRGVHFLITFREIQMTPCGESQSLWTAFVGLKAAPGK